MSSVMDIDTDESPTPTATPIAQPTTETLFRPESAVEADSVRMNEAPSAILAYLFAATV